MKANICLFIVILFSISSFGQATEKASITIFSVNFYTRAIFTVTCDKFTRAFKGQMKTKQVSAKDSIDILDQLIKKIKTIKSEDDFDTRAKLIYKSNHGNEIVFCVNHFDILINGGLVKHNKKLSEFILSLIPKEQLIK